MTIRVACPGCRKEYNLAPDLVGKRVRCKACQTSFPVPGNATANGGGDEAPGRAAAVQAAPGAAQRPVRQEILDVEPAEDDDAPPRPAKSNTLLFVLIGGAVAVLLLCGGVITVLVVGALFLVPTKTPTPVSSGPTITVSPNPPPNQPQDPQPNPPKNPNPKPNPPKERAP
jgi:hypothetical protein